MAGRKYVYERGELIGDSMIRYLNDTQYAGTHRQIIGQCDLCNTIKVFRLDSIITGRTKTYGCMHEEMIKSGKLAAFSVHARKQKPYLQKGGWSSRMSYGIVIPEHYYDLVKDMTIEQLIGGKIGKKES